jgi:microcystin-dependent protein
MPKVEDQLLSTGGIKITGAGEAPGKVLTSDAAGVGTWQAATGSSGGGLETTPIGTIMAFGAPVAPSGYLNCDGSAISRTVYSALFAAIGTTFGVGDGATTFNLPDLRGRGVIGVGQGASLTNRVLGAIGGEETHVLTVAEMPSHSHTLAVSLNPGNGLNGPGGTTGASSGANMGGINNTGGDGSHNTMQPFVVTNYIIKAVAQPAGQQLALAAGTIPYCRSYRNAAQNITATGGWQKVLLDTAPENTDNIFDAANNRLVIKTPGVYVVTGGIYFGNLAAAFGANSIRYAGIFVNGVQIKEISVSAQSVDTTRTGGMLSFTRKLNAGDYVELMGAVFGGPDSSVNHAETGIEVAWIGEGRGVVGEQSIPFAQVRKTANQAIAAATWGSVVWDAEDNDTDNIFDTAANTRFTIRTPGVYSIRWSPYIQRVAADNDFRILKNGAQIVAYKTSAMSTANDIIDNVETVIPLNTGDYIEFQILGARTAFNGGANYYHIAQIVMVSPAAKAVIPYVKMRKSANQAIAPNGWVALSWDTEDADNDGTHDTVTNNSRIVSQVSRRLHVQRVALAFGRRWRNDLPAHHRLLEERCRVGARGVDIGQRRRADEVALDAS